MKASSFRYRAVMVLGAASIFFGSPASPARAANDMHWTVGAGLGARPDYEGSNDYRLIPIGYFRMKWDDARYVAVKGTESSGAAVRLEGNLLASEWVELGPILQYRLERDDVTSGRVDAMSSVDAAIEAGGFLGFRDNAWRLRTTAATDVSGAHDGTLVELLGGYERDYDSGVGVEWHVASTWASDGYMGTYFNVDAGDAVSSGLPTYDADAGFKDVGTRLMMSWGDDQWLEGWRLIGVASYFRMLGDAEDSPVVDEAGDPNQLFGGLAVAYAR